MGPRFRGGDVVGLGVALTLLLPAPALADSALPPAELAFTQLPDARQEAQAKTLMETLRCLVCQGQSIADSDAEMAGDMRALVRQKIAAGESPSAIRKWLIERYGDYVTYDPPFDWLTAPLWLLPLLLLAAGVAVARRSFGRSDPAIEGEEA
ncbi:MAG: cytochrome c-type biogenesis protein [Sphingomonas sp.]